MAGLLDLTDNGLPGSQSSIASLLQTLMAPPAPPQTPGMPQGPTGPAAGGPVLPTITPPPAVPPKPPGLVDRIKGHLAGLLDVNAPQGYDSLLSPDEIAQAKPSLLSRIIGGPDALSPTHQYQENLNHILGMHQVAAQLGEQRRVQTAIATMPRLPENATEDQFKTWAQKAYAHAIENNLPEDIKSKFASIVTESIKAPKPDMSKVVAPGGALVDSQGKPLYVAPAAEKAPLPGSPEWKATEEWKASLAAKYRVEPTQIIQGADNSGAMHFYRVPKDGGAPVMIDGMAPKVTLKTENAQQELTRARAEAAVSEMNNGAAYMHEFEQKLARGQVHIGNAGQIVQSIANTFTHDDPASKIIQNSALSLLNKTNPDLARYIRRALSFAEGESMISSRPSDFRTRMSAFLSAAANGASPELIGDIESRRNSIMTPLNRIYSQSAPGGAKPAPSGPASAGRKITVNGKTYTVPH